MARYIDAVKAIELIKEQKGKETGAFSKGRNIGLNIARSIINNAEALPTADVEEVKHGEWKEAEGGLFYCCTNCGYIVEYQLTSGCPNCRAKMDGGKEE